MLMGTNLGIGIGILPSSMSRRGGLPAFDPTLYGTPLFSFDPDDLTTQTVVSGKLSQWNDMGGKGGTSKNLVQATAARRFTVTTRGGYRCFQSVLANDTWMGTVNGAISSLRELTLFMVVSGLDAFSQDGGLINFPKNTGHDYDPELLELECTPTGLKAYSAMSPPLILEDAFPDSSQWSIITLQITGDDGTGFLQVDNGTPVEGSYGGVVMQSTKMGIGTRFLDGAWGAVGVDCFYRHITAFDSTISAGNISAAKTALAARSGRIL